jgi:hypothetical protein
MLKFLPKLVRGLLQLVGIVKKYEPVAEEAYKAAKPIVADLLKKQAKPVPPPVKR